MKSTAPEVVTGGVPHFEHPRICRGGASTICSPTNPKHSRGLGLSGRTHSGADHSTNSGTVTGVAPASSLATGHTRAASFGEALTNVIVGYAVALGAQQLIFPLFGFQASLAQHGAIAGAFTLVSLLRSYALRRFFEHLAHLRQIEEQQRLWRLQQRYRTGMLQ